MGSKLIPNYSLQVEFLDYGEHGMHCQFFIRKGEERVASTPPQPANLQICLDLLCSIAKSFEIPEAECAGLGIMLETAFRQRTKTVRERIEAERQRIVPATPLDTALVTITSNILTALKECEARKKK